MMTQYSSNSHVALHANVCPQVPFTPRKSLFRVRKKIRKGVKVVKVLKVDAECVKSMTPESRLSLSHRLPLPLIISPRTPSHCPLRTSKNIAAAAAELRGRVLSLREKGNSAKFLSHISFISPSCLLSLSLSPLSQMCSSC